MRATHLVFDLDDTLYPERDYAIGGFRAAVAWAKSELGVDVDAQHMTRLLDEGHLGKLFAIALRAAKADHTADDLAGFVRAYGRHTPDLALFADAAAALDHWHGRVRLGLVTDGNPRSQQAKIDALGLGPRFDHVVLTGALGAERAYHKPHPRAFELIEAELGSPRDHFVYVGDNLAKDFIAPNARGWTTICIDRPAHRRHRIHKHDRPAPGGEPQHTVDDLRKLTDLLA